MALTKISRSLLDTGVSDSSDATAITIDSSEKVGIGSSPTEKLTVNGALAITGSLADDRTSTGAMDFSSGVTRFVSYGASGTGGEFAFRTASGGASSTERVRIDSSGQLGIGTSDPATWAGNLLQTGTQSLFGQLTTNKAAYMVNNTAYDGSDWKYITNGTASIYAQDHSDSNAHVWYTVASGTAGNNCTLAQQMKLDVNGNLIVNNLHGSTASNPAVKYNATSGLLYYDTSSIRYKENVQDLPNSLEKIKALRPVTFDEKSTGDSCTGLIAEEVIEQIPDLVHLLDVEGYDTPQPNSVDYAKLSVYLLKAIQEQQTVIEDLKSRIETLEG